MVIEGSNEIRTLKGDFPVSFFENQDCEVWDGKTFSKVTIKKYDLSRKIFKYTFGCHFSYDGMTLDAGIPFETHIWCDIFFFSDRFGNVFDSSYLEIGEFIADYEDDGDRFLKSFFTGISEERETDKNLFFIEDKSSILVNDLLINSGP